MATIGNTNKQTWGQVWTGLNSQNQVAARITMPSAGTITRLGAWLAGKDTGATVRLCVWNSSGTLLAQTNTFTATGRPFGTGNSDNYERDLQTPLDVNSGQVLYVGFSANAADSRQWGIASSGTHYRDTDTTPPGDASFASNSGTIGAYAIYETNQAPDAPTRLAPPNGGAVTSATPTISFRHNDPDGDAVDHYDLQVDNNSDFSSPLWDVINATNGISGDTITRTYGGAALSPGVTYHWRARTQDPGGKQGPWGGPWTFRLNTAPTVSARNPGASDFAHIHNLATDPTIWTTGGAHAKPRFSWTFSDADGHDQSAYRVRVYSASTGGTLLHDSGKVLSSTKQYDTGLSSGSGSSGGTWAAVRGTQYWWTVEVWDAVDVSSGEQARTAFKVQWGQAIYEYAVTGGTASSAWQWANTTPPANTQAGFLFASATGAGGAGRSAWSTSIGAVSPSAYLNVMVRLATSAPGTNAPLADMTFTYSASGVTPDRWTFSPAGQWTLDEARRRFGTRALKYLNASSVTATATSRTFRVQPGRYTASVWVYTAAPFNAANVFRMRLYAVGSATPIDPLAPEATIQDTGGRWERIQTRFDVPEGVTDAYLVLEYTNTAAATTSDAVWLDAVQFEEGDAAKPWQPGAVSDAAVLDVGGVMIDATKGGVFRLRSGAGGYVELEDSTLPGAPAMTFEDYIRIIRTAADNFLIEGHTGTNRTFHIERDGEIGWHDPATGAEDITLARTADGVLAVAGGRLQTPSADVEEGADLRNGNSAGTNYPIGLSIMRITDSAAAGWPVADGRGLVVTFNVSGSALCMQLWMQRGSLGNAIYFRSWNAGTSAWRAWAAL